MIKVVGLDIYGTVLASGDTHNVLQPRRGLEMFFNNCDALGVLVASCSDGYPANVQFDLRESGVDIERFDKFFRLDQCPLKDFGQVLDHYKINPFELLVIGDNPTKDILSAKKIGAKYLEVSKYFDEQDGFDFSEIDFDSFRR